MSIQPIVEGHGDVTALPVLLRRFVAEAGAWTIGIGRPIRHSRYHLTKQAGVERAVRLALNVEGTSAVLILFDGDGDCPATLGPTVHAWATAAAGDTPCEVVLAHREYEAWFLAAIESLRGHRDVKADAEIHLNPEEPRGAKEKLEARMERGYVETSDQAALSAQFSLAAAYSRSRSFRKLASSFGALARATGRELAWPPAHWRTPVS